MFFSVLRTMVCIGVPSWHVFLAWPSACAAAVWPWLVLSSCAMGAFARWWLLLTTVWCGTLRLRCRVLWMRWRSSGRLGPSGCSSATSTWSPLWSPWRPTWLGALRCLGTRTLRRQSACRARVSRAGAWTLRSAVALWLPRASGSAGSFQIMLRWLTTWTWALLLALGALLSAPWLEIPSPRRPGCGGGRRLPLMRRWRRAT